MNRETPSHRDRETGLENVDHGEQVLSAALVVMGLFVLMTTKGAILGVPISLIAVVLIPIGGCALIRAFV
jgi:hypothetical protein